MALVIVGEPKNVQRYIKQRGAENGVDPATGQRVEYGGLKRFPAQSRGQMRNPYIDNPEYRVAQGTIKSIRDGNGNEPGTKGFDPDAKMLIKGVANANVVDRWDERMEPAGMDIKNFVKNKILLADHMYWTNAGVGVVEKIWAEENGVHFEAWVGDPKAGLLTDAQKDVRSLISQGILKTVSIGFIPKKIKAPVYDEESGKLMEPAVVLEWELLELSVVAIPCNPDATFEMRQYANSLHKSHGSCNNEIKTIEIDDKALNGMDPGQKIAHLKQQSTTVQTLIFDKEKFTKQQAIDWAEEHDFKSDGVDETEDSYRIRQRDPDEFIEDSFRTIELDDGIKAVIGKLKDDEGDSEMEEKILEAINNLMTLCQSMNGTMEKTLEATNNLMKKLEEKGGDKPKEDDDKDKDGDKSLADQVKEISETVKAQGENITKLSEAMLKMAEANKAE